MAERFVPVDGNDEYVDQTPFVTAVSLLQYYPGEDTTQLLVSKAIAMLRARQIVYRDDGDRTADYGSAIHSAIGTLAVLEENEALLQVFEVIGNLSFNYSKRIRLDGVYWAHYGSSGWTVGSETLAPCH